ncbi:peptidoglycan hydrolase RipC [Candidatus Mycobacterium wuenschmannii]|uniref:Peptidoglycan hydrolase RipC n=1 Tax=Candidatus Mycobacterium wuenschmannii TaxID=3027808 RepID=A0ABY8W5G4_9MYCO|nr:peptidoglycan hydrolase RipC [Candidatus Mycobacterium wuenschmannii]WIM90224.1 peptidoglycan hydrolase RipC [Candidatus Mycobacterium wuenschmannii]
MGALAGLVALSAVTASDVAADPANDAMAKLNELSRQAEQTTEAMHSAQLDLNNKLAAQKTADTKHTDAVAAADAAKTRLATFQTGVDKFAAAMYMGGRTDGMNAIMTAESPQQLIGKLAVSRVISTAMLAQMATYRATREEAAKAEQESSKSAAEAKTAAEQAASVRANLQSKQSRLQLQIGIVKSQYLALSPHDRTALAAPGPPPPPAALAAAAAPAPEALPPGGGQGAPGPGAGPGSGQGQIAVQAALTRVGDPYSWGGASPGGFDCSGLVMWAFQQAGIALPHSSQALAHGGQPVSLSDLQPGDVLTFYSDASHAGLYIGDGMMIHSSTYGVPVRVVPMNSSGPIYDARRY